MMLLPKGLLLLAAASFCASAAQYTVGLTPANTKIDWTLSATAHTVHGTFALKHGTVTFDSETGKASGEVVADLSTGQTGNDGRDKNMHARVLESAKYPEAVFTVDRFEGKFDPAGASAVKLHGAFKIHGVAHELTMDVKSKSANGQLDADITFSIPFISWGMKDPSNFLLKVGKTVDVAIHTTAPLQR